jgi:DNA polymerase III subunit delta
MDALTFLSRQPKGQPQPIYVLAGDEDFLKRQAVGVLKRWVLGEEDAYGLSEYPADAAEWSAVRDELATLPFLGPRRLIVIENADPFVTKFRSQLEKYVAQPLSTGVLVLTVKTFPATTRLAKLLTESTINCKSPSQLLVDLVGTEMGLLDQELAKLAVYVGSAARIDNDDVDRLVGRSQSANVFKVFDAVGTGRAGDALAILDQLLGQGEDPFGVLGAFSWQLRRMAKAARLAISGSSMGDALDRAGVASWPEARRSAEQLLRHLGRRRASQIFDWLLEIDLGLKGSSPLPPRTLLERLLVRMAAKN